METCFYFSGFEFEVKIWYSERNSEKLAYWHAVTVTVLYVLLQPKLINFCCWLKDTEGMTLNSSGSLHERCLVGFFLVALWVAFVVSVIILFFLSYFALKCFLFIQR